MTLDFTALGAAYAAGLACLLLGYVFAGPVWVERHSIQLAGPGRPRRVSGFWGESVLFTACAAVAGTVRAFTDVAILRDVIAPHAGVAVGAFAAVLVAVLLYSNSVVAGAKRDGKDKLYCARLRAAYLPYTIYSAILFAGGVTVIALLALEFVYDQHAFNAQAETVRASVNAAAQVAHAGADPLESARRALTYLEDALG